MAVEFFIDQVPITHSDPRRALIEFYNGDASFQNARLIMINQPKPGQETVLGGHYHNDKELLFIVSGTLAELRVKGIENGDIFKITQLESGTRIFLPPNFAHKLVFSDAAILIALSGEPYLPSKLIPYSI